jgi:hypothetical protein
MNRFVYQPQRRRIGHSNSRLVRLTGTYKLLVARAFLIYRTVLMLGVTKHFPDPFSYFASVRPSLALGLSYGYDASQVV